MKNKFRLFGFATALVFVLNIAVVESETAQAEPQCNTRDSVIQQLADKYKESRVALGVTHNGGLIEILSTDTGKTWSIIITSPQGMSCLVAAGEGFKILDQTLRDPEA